jgi:transcriptional regulator with XRE-family HTH domain
VTSRLTSTRIGAGLSVAQASKLLGWHPDNLIAIESGEHPPSPTGLRKLAELYRCSVAWLRGETAKLSAGNEALLETVDHDGDRATVREFMEMISTRDPGEPAPPSAAERLASRRR